MTEAYTPLQSNIQPPGMDGEKNEYNNFLECLMSKSQTGND